jgi:hypothetical protein
LLRARLFKLVRGPHSEGRTGAAAEPPSV